MGSSWGRPSGPLDASWVIVGRDFGEEEVAAGQPFVGAAGKLLDRALHRAGLVRAEALVTNVVNTQPPANRWDQHQPADVQRGVEELHTLLDRQPRRLIVALGEEALQAVCTGSPYTVPPRDATITETRGYVFPSKFGPVLAMVHPAFVLRNWAPWWATFALDWRKAARLVVSGYAVPKRNEVILGTDATLPDVLFQSRLLAVDIETTPSLQISCVGLSGDGQTGFVMPWNEGDAPKLRQLQALLASDVPKTFQNGQFDTTILERHGMLVRHWAYDTMFLWHATEPFLAGRQERKRAQRTEKSLRFLASLFTDEPWWKDYAFTSPDEQYRLCAKDARITHEVTEALLGD